MKQTNLACSEEEEQGFFFRKGKRIVSGAKKTANTGGGGDEVTLRGPRSPAGGDIEEKMVVLDEIETD